jgi:hypothetical protein
MLTALEGTSEINTLHLSIEKDKVTIDLNDRNIPTNPFVTNIFRNTIFGMVSSLKGVGEIRELLINIIR